MSSRPMADQTSVLCHQLGQIETPVFDTEGRDILRFQVKQTSEESDPQFPSGGMTVFEILHSTDGIDFEPLSYLNACDKMSAALVCARFVKAKIVGTPTDPSHSYNVTLASRPGLPSGIERVHQLDEGIQAWNGTSGIPSLVHGQSMDVRAFKKVVIAYDIYANNGGTPGGTFSIEGEAGDGYFTTLESVVLTDDKYGFLSVDVEHIKTIRMHWLDTGGVEMAGYFHGTFIG